MRRKLHISYDGINEYFISAIPIDNINYNVFVEAFYKLSKNLTLDGYTSEQFREFTIYGFTEQRVDAAPDVPMSDDQMMLFAYDSEFKSPVGLAICFNGRFYSIGYSEGKKSESELLNIYKHIK